MHTLHHSLHYMQYLQTLKGKLVASLTIRDFAANMTGLFIPIFLYSFGYSLTFIATFYVLYYIVSWFMYSLSARVVAKRGLYHALFLSYICMALGNGLLSLGGESVTFVYLAFVPLIIGEKCFWPARHIDIARLFAEGETMKRTASIINTLNMFVAAIAPLFGGLLAARFGAGAALLASFFVMLFAVGLLWQEYVKERGEPIRSTFDVSSFGKDMLGNAAMNLQSIVGALLWTVFIYLSIADFSTIGLIFSITFAASMLATFASGNWFDKFPYFKLGLVLRTLTFPLRAMSTSLGMIFGVDLLSTVSSGLMNSRYTARYYNQAKHSQDIDSYVYSMEKAGELGKLFVFSLLLALLLFGLEPKTAIVACFGLAFITTPLLALVGNKNQE